MLFAAAALAFFCVYANCVRLAITYAQSPHQKSKYVTMSSLKILITFLYTTSLLASYQLDWGATMRFVFGLSAVGTSGTLSAISAVFTGGTSCAISTSGAYVTLYTLSAVGTLCAIRTSRTLCTIRTSGAEVTL